MEGVDKDSGVSLLLTTSSVLDGMAVFGTSSILSLAGGDISSRLWIEGMEEAPNLNKGIISSQSWLANQPSWLVGRSQTQLSQSRQDNSAPFVELLHKQKPTGDGFKKSGTENLDSCG